MKAGRELDALVAEKVMGCHERKRRHGYGWLYDLVIPGGVDAVDFVEPGACWSACPPYSTDIRAAWTVVEKAFKEVDFTLDRVGDTWKAGVKSDDYDNGWSWEDLSKVGSAPTAPLAICLAALKHA